DGLAELPDAERLRVAEADVLRANGKTREAVDALDRLASAAPDGGGHLATLLAMFLSLPEAELAEELAEREARLAKDPEDHVARFLVGTRLHYRDEFARSTAMLAPLERVYAGEPRLQIYLAMNDFNLGKRDEALARLDRARALPAMDPDVYYCRAELLRDGPRRAEALAELRRYLT